jgi:hypothetical protein
MARNRRRKGGLLRKVLLIAAVAVTFYIATHALAYIDEDRYVQHYIDTHTTAPATPGH